MKKTLIFLFTAVCAVCLFAQTVKVYKGGTLQYELADADSVVFCETAGGKISQGFVKGQKVTISTDMNNKGSNLTQAIGTDNGTTIDYTWEEGDSVLVKVNSETAVFKLVSGAGTKSATFEGEMPAGGNSFDIQYPVEEPNITSQDYNNNLMPKDKLLFKATDCTLGNNVQLVPQYSILQVNFKGTQTIKKLIVSGISNNDETYTLNINPEVTLNGTAKAFYVIMPKINERLKVRLIDNTNTLKAAFTTSKAIDLSSNACINMADLNVPEHNYPCFTALEDGCEVNISLEAFVFNDRYLEILKEGDSDWTALDVQYVIDHKGALEANISLDEGEKLYMRATLGEVNNVFTIQDPDVPIFTTSGELKFSGDISYLIKGDGTATKDDMEFSEYYDIGCFQQLFAGTTIVDASDLILPSYTKQACYFEMFAGCENLLYPPELPATDMDKDSYTYMFSSCTSLRNAPALPAKTLAEGCYEGMFAGCTSLIVAPELPAMQLAFLCYSDMFSGCTNLIQAPQLIASNLESSCYGTMFSGCSKLASVTMLANEDQLGKFCTFIAWLENAGTSASGTPTVYVKNAAVKTALEGVEYGAGKAVPSNWTVAVKP